MKAEKSPCPRVEDRGSWGPCVPCPRVLRPREVGSVGDLRAVWERGAEGADGFFGFRIGFQGADGEVSGAVIAVAGVKHSDVGRAVNMTGLTMEQHRDAVTAGGVFVGEDVGGCEDVLHGKIRGIRG